MAYLIRPGEPVGEEIRRILLEQDERALAWLRRWQANPRDNVHRARQAFKRIRAALRVVRSGMPYAWRVENAVFRDVGRTLAYARDAEAVIDALALLEERMAGPLHRESVHLLRTRLEQRAARERDCGVRDLEGRIAAACTQLAAARRRFRDLPVGDLRRKDLRRGLAATLERCARGHERASASGRAEDLHAWRKDVKYAGYQFALVERLNMARAATRRPRFAELGRLLGHHQDLATLDALLRAQPAELGADLHLRAMRQAIRGAQADLAREALRAGGRLVGRAAAGAGRGRDRAPA